MGTSVFCPAPVVIAPHAAYGPASFTPRAFVYFDRVGPGLFLCDQFLLLGGIVFLVFRLEVVLERA